jgi:hypothetical protein
MMMMIMMMMVNNTCETGEWPKDLQPKGKKNAANIA